MPEGEGREQQCRGPVDEALHAGVEAAAQPADGGTEREPHSAEPASTPAIIGQGDAGAPCAASAPNTAMNEKIVAGLDSVSKKVPAKAAASPARSCTAAVRVAGAERQVRQASQSRKPPPNSASGARARVSTPISELTPKAPMAP